MWDVVGLGSWDFGCTGLPVSSPRAGLEFGSRVQCMGVEELESRALQLGLLVVSKLGILRLVLLSLQGLLREFWVLRLDQGYL